MSPTAWTASTVLCTACQATLAVPHASADRLIRCAACNHQFRVLTKSHTAGFSRMARWSLWLGLGSLLAGFFAGIPAVLIGWRALRLSRRSPRSRERRWAKTGVVLGSVCSVLGSLLVLLGALVGSMIAYSTEVTADAARVEEIAHELVPVALPSYLKPQRGVRLPLGITFAVYADQDESSDRGSMLVMAYAPPWTNADPQQMLDQLRRDSLKEEDAEFELSTFFEPIGNACPARVRVDHYVGRKFDRRVRLYHAVLNRPKRPVAVLLVVKEPPRATQSRDSDAAATTQRSPLSEDDVRQLFESLASAHGDK
jgi:hypothetical protein